MSLMKTPFLLFTFLLVACADEGAPRDAGGNDSALGSCENPPDESAVARRDYGPMMDRDYRQVATGCALDCIAASDFAGCAEDCLDLGTSQSASTSCASCYVDAANCALTNCLPRCAADPMSEDCLRCRCGDNDATRNCVGDFEVCAGLPSPLCDGL